MKLKLWMAGILSAVAFTACQREIPSQPDTPLKDVVVNNSDPSKSTYRAAGDADAAATKRARIRAKIDSVYAVLDQANLAKKATTYTLGYFQEPYIANCWGSDETVVFMDDEDDTNGSRLEKDSTTGRVPAVWSYSSSEEFVYSNYTHPTWGNNVFSGIGQPNYGRETKFRICKRTVSSLPRVTFDYAVVVLDGYCPPETEPFSRYWDNEDNGNANYYTGTFDLPNFQNSDGTHIGFCFVPKDPAATMSIDQAISIATGLGGVLARPDNFPVSSSQYHQGWLLTDDEDTNNSNWWGTDYTSYSARINNFFGNSAVANTQMFFIWQRPIPVGI